MPKKPTAPKNVKAPAKRGAGYPALIKAISQVNTQMVTRVATVANQALVLRNWIIGAYIVEFEQEGADRAKYGARLLETLAGDLKEQELKGLGLRMLRDCRTFFLLYPEIRQPLVAEFMDQLPASIRQPVVAELLSASAVEKNRGPVDTKFQSAQPISQAVVGKFELPGYEGAISQPLVGKSPTLPIRQPVTAESQNAQPISNTVGGKSALSGPTADSGTTGCKIGQAPLDQLPTPLKPEQLARISWAHFLELIRLDDPWKRAFYENELLKGHWSKRQLQRQIGSLLYERTALSTDKKAVIERARRQEPRETIQDMLRDPYILEFTGLAELPSYSEEELESALLDHLQGFLLELGRGFCFEARQFRMTEGRRHHRVDLVFYHRVLRCHVLIDLKIRAFKPADAGQMNFYVNWFKANMMEPGDNPPVGILLCSDHDGAEVEFATAGMDTKLFVSRYLKALPSAEQLKAFLERDRAEIGALTSNRKRSKD